MLKLRTLLYLSLSFLLGCSGTATTPVEQQTGDPEDPGGKADSPVDADKIGIDHGNGKIPLSEVSGLALRSWKGDTQLLAIGDAELSFAVATLPSSSKPSELQFKRYKVEDLLPYPPPSQWEGVVADVQGRVFVLEENPGAVHVFSPELDECLHTYELVVDSSGPKWKEELAKQWEADSNSRGEGLALGTHGHLFILKEKADSLIIEFGPEGDEPVGLSGPVGEFSLAQARSVLVPLRVWKFADSARKVLSDMSDLFADDQGRLFVISGEQRTIGRVREWLDPEDEGKLHLDAAWTLPDSIENPEGLVLVDQNEPWVATDAKDEVNLFELDRIEP